MPAATTHSSLAITLNQWRGEVGRYFGFGRTYSGMTASQQADVDAVIDRGMRQFYAPPILSDGSSHIWSFMRPTMNIAVHAPYSDGTLTTIDSTPSSTGLFTGTTLPTWVGNGVLMFMHPATDVQTLLHIYARLTNTTVSFEDAVLSDEVTAAALSYVITDGIQALPTSFAGITGDAVLSSGSACSHIRHVAEDKIDGMFGANPSRLGTPTHFCVRPWRNPNIDRIGTEGSAGMYTRYEIVFYPRPDAVYTISFRYLFMFPGVTDWAATGQATTDINPPGMAYHHETMLASCLAVAEQFADSPNAEHRSYFEKRIDASAALDRKIAGSPFMGQNLDRSDNLHSQGRFSSSVNVSYTGPIIP